VGGLYLRIAVEDDALQPFGAHHCPQPGASGHASAVIVDTGDQGKFLGGRANAAGLAVGAAQILQGGFGLHGVQAPQRAGVHELRTSAGDFQNNWVRTDTFEEDAIIAAAFDRFGQGAAAVGFTPCAGQW